MKKKKLKLHRDTREQLGLEFTNRVFDEIVDECLPYGDYMCSVEDSSTISGWRQYPITCERKGFGDLWTTMASKEYERFKREVDRAKEADVMMILFIEGSMRKVAQGYKYSRFKGS